MFGHSVVSMTLKCCSSKLYFYQFQNIKTKLDSNNCYVKKIPISCSTNVQSRNFNMHHYKNFYLSTNGNGSFFFFTNLKKVITSERSKNKQKYCSAQS